MPDTPPPVGDAIATVGGVVSVVVDDVERAAATAPAALTRP